MQNFKKPSRNHTNKGIKMNNFKNIRNCYHVITNLMQQLDLLLNTGIYESICICLIWGYTLWCLGTIYPLHCRENHAMMLLSAKGMLNPIGLLLLQFLQVSSVLGSHQDHTTSTKKCGHINETQCLKCTKHITLLLELFLWLLQMNNLIQSW